MAITKRQTSIVTYKGVLAYGILVPLSAIGSSSVNALFVLNPHFVAPDLSSYFLRTASIITINVGTAMMIEKTVSTVLSLGEKAPQNEDMEDGNNDEPSPLFYLAGTFAIVGLLVGWSMTRNGARSATS